MPRNNGAAVRVLGVVDVDGGRQRRAGGSSKRSNGQTLTLRGFVSAALRERQLWSPIARVHGHRKSSTRQKANGSEAVSASVLKSRPRTRPPQWRRESKRRPILWQCRRMTRSIADGIATARSPSDPAPLNLPDDGCYLRWSFGSIGNWHHGTPVSCSGRP